MAVCKCIENFFVYPQEIMNFLWVIEFNGIYTCYMHETKDFEKFGSQLSVLIAKKKANEYFWVPL